MNVSKRVVTGEGFHVVFAPPLSIRPKDQFGIASKYNDVTKLNDYFFIPPNSDVAHRVKHKTYDKLIAQSKGL